MYIYIYIHIHTYTYIYIYREREREIYIHNTPRMIFRRGGTPVAVPKLLITMTITIQGWTNLPEAIPARTL